MKKITAANFAENRKIYLSGAKTHVFFKSEVFKQVGLYQTNLKIAGDFEYFVRCFLKHKLKFNYFDECLVYMSTGGTSGKNMLSYLISSKEINQSLKSNKIYILDHFQCN